MLYFLIKEDKNLTMTPTRHPGFLSFGSVRNYTLISPSSPCIKFDLGIRSAGRGHLRIYNKLESLKVVKLWLRLNIAKI